MTREIVRLRWADYDASTSYYFLAPDGVGEKEFGTMCDSLIAEATRMVIRLRGNVPEDKPEYAPQWIRWEAIVQTMAFLLEQRGYEKVILPTKVYSGVAINFHCDDTEGVLASAGVLDEAVQASRWADKQNGNVRWRRK